MRVRAGEGEKDTIQHSFIAVVSNEDVVMRLTMMMMMKIIALTVTAKITSQIYVMELGEAAEQMAAVNTVTRRIKEQISR